MKFTDQEIIIKCLFCEKDYWKPDSQWVGRNICMSCIKDVARKSFDELLESRFQEFGKWGGKYATPEGRAEELAFWDATGEYGVEWLINRVGQGVDQDAEERVAATLAKMEPVSYNIITNKLLYDGLQVGEIYVMLGAARYFKDLTDKDWKKITKIKQIILRFLYNEDIGIKERAVAITEILPKENAFFFLNNILAIEYDPQIRQVIKDCLEARS